MRTLGSVYDEVLGLMFSNNTGDTKVGLDEAAVKEYMFNMHHAFNSGIDDLYSSAVNMCDLIVIEDAEPGKLYNLKELYKDKELYIASTDKVHYKNKDTGIYENTVYFSYLTDDIITFEVGGNFSIAVRVKPIKKIEENTSSETVIDIEEFIVSALAYYMAYRLYLEDDVSIATSYLNVYESKKEELNKLSVERKSTALAMRTFESTRGWY